MAKVHSTEETVGHDVTLHRTRWPSLRCTCVKSCQASKLALQGIDPSLATRFRAFRLQVISMFSVAIELERHAYADTEDTQMQLQVLTTTERKLYLSCVLPVFMKHKQVTADSLISTLHCSSE